ncbi:hypothetical protein [Erythrobacter mangrovi]|uniref:Uncharacterized protein n=1 Tax=Erythrobacter mangrovi TaxID=2739433 RepID=A0A7D3XID9_9SPHN|nr:hypothetical protein [Erythrobacter mangrovi]QKG72033.1 hypothetical protein HQR01_12025 [Erythrobacter mangrovi]
MFGKIIGAIAGSQLAKQTDQIGGASGAAIGVIAAGALRRLSLPAMIALGTGGYLAKKYVDRRGIERNGVHKDAAPEGVKRRSN